MRRLTCLLMLCLLFSLVWAGAAQAGSVNDRDLIPREVSDYSFADEMNNNWRGTPATGLGTFTADGNSPGYIVGRSYADRQAWYHARHMIDWRAPYPSIHFVYQAQMLAGDNPAITATWMDYTAFVPTTGPQGVWQTTVMMQQYPFSFTGMFPQMDVDETGHGMPVGHVFNPSASPLVRNAEINWDVAGPGAYGTFVGDTLPQSLSTDPASSIAYPMIEYQEYDGTQVTHMLCLEPADPYPLTYWRRVGGNPTIGGWSMTPITDSRAGHRTLVASRATGVRANRVAVAWAQVEPDCPLNNVVYKESTDGGVSWGAIGTETGILNYTGTGEEYMAWVELDAMYDSDGYLHIVFPTMQIMDGTDGGIDPTRIFHWTDRVAGDNAGGKLTTISISDFNGLAPMCGRAGTNVANAAKAAISQCNDRLYVMWQQFGDPEAGDSLDCPTENVWTGGYNSDLFISVSSGLDGSLWDKRRDVTNSHNPGCDSTTANNCDSDNYHSLARRGMNVADMGTTYWEAVPEAYAVRDALAPTHANDGWYIDVQYVDDLYAGVVNWRDAPADVWTYNPIKWFRLPCVEPIIQPAINCSHEDFLAPTDWVPTGTPVVIEDVKVENIGNAILSVSAIDATVTTGDPSWVTISGTPGAIDPGGSMFFDVNLNPGGIITTQTILEATITIDSDDPDRSTITAFEISTVVADTVVQVTWDTVNNTSNFALTVANQGQMGHSGWGNVNMDFIYMDSTGPDCTLDSGTTEHVYLYDGCPVMMIDDTEDFGSYGWNPFWIPARASEHDFRPVAGNGTSKNTGDDHMEYVSDTFVSPDSSIKFIKHTYIIDGNSFVVEGYKITADATTDMYFGEWIDWDIPTLGTGNQGGTVAAPGGVSYVYQQGYNDLTADPPACLDPERRFGASGLLGYWYYSEDEADSEVRHTDLFGGHVLLDDDLFLTGTDQFIHDSAWAWMGRNSLSTNNTEDEDQQVFLTFGQHEIRTDDTLYVYVVHATVYDGDTDALQAVIDDADAWFDSTIVNPPTGCCGIYTDGIIWPLGYTGNTNCSYDGKRTLSDITKLIDNVYISKEALCCYNAGN